MGQGSTTTLCYRELGVRWQAAGVMSAAALKVALSFSGKLFTELTTAFGNFHPARARRSGGPEGLDTGVECVQEMHGRIPTPTHSPRRRARRESFWPN